MYKIIITAFLLGLVFKITPGPVFAATVRSGIRGGFRSAFSVQIGALVGDTLWAVAGLAGVGFLFHLKSSQTPIYVASFFYLLWLAWDSWRESKGKYAINVSPKEISSRFAIRSGLLLSLTNPQNIVYWAVIGSSLGAIGINNPTMLHYTIFYFAFIISTIIGSFIISAFIHRMFRHVGIKWAKYTYRLCAFVFMILAILLLKELLGSVLN